ncbi:MAG TPA: hypothetical protein VFS10_18335 [Pyrinomonadaceae bacterium]|nr:hypothetical protein [Pyrinomonadaceae bacterium]
MTDEERQRQMDFIVNQQAEFSVRLDRLGDKVEGLADAQRRSDERWARTEEGIRSLLARVLKRRSEEGQGEQTGD